MDADAFWTLIERSGRETGTKKARLAWLDRQLNTLSADDIIDFQMWTDICQYRSNTWELWAAYFAVFGSGSDDGFLYFRSWLVSLGRETFECVVAEPDRLIEVLEVLHLWDLVRERTDDELLWTNDEWPEFESLAYVAWDPYEKLTGLEPDTLQDAAHERSGLGEDYFELRGERWIIDSDEELERRFPRIARYWAQRAEVSGSETDASGGGAPVPG
jgi:hypothetical protein